MALGYRSFFTVVGDQSTTEELIMEQYNGWLKDSPKLKPRHLNRDLYELNSLTLFRSGAELIYFERVTQDKSRSVRMRLTEDTKGNGEKWTTTLTLHFPKKRNDQTLVLYETDAPLETNSWGLQVPKWVGNPDLIRRILEVVDARDGMDRTITVSKDPSILDVEDVENLFDDLCDPERHIALLLAGTHQGENPRSRLGYLSRLAEYSLGVCTSYALTPEATDQLNDLMGADHAVWGSRVRAYMRDFDPAVSVNARIHPVYRLDLDDATIKKTARNLGVRVRRDLTEVPLYQVSRELHKIESSLVDREYEILLSGKKIKEEAPQKAVSRAVDSVDEGASKYLVLHDIFRSRLGIDDLNQETIYEIVDKVARHEVLVEKLESTRQEIRELEDSRDAHFADAQDFSVEYSIVFEENTRLQDRLAYLQKELARTERFGNAWIPMPEEDVTYYPKSFSELLDNMEQLECLQFTGDEAGVLDLERTDLGGRAGNTWKQLRGLNGYALAKNSGRVTNLKSYVDNPPDGYAPLAASAFRPKESETTTNSPRLAGQRLLPVPLVVDANGLVPMYAHLTIGKRVHVHFLDDLKNTGKIYIGRIGLHLDTVSTN